MKTFISFITVILILFSFPVCFAENSQESANYMKNQTSELSVHALEVTKEQDTELPSPEPSGIPEDTEMLKPSDTLTKTPEPLPTSNQLATSLETLVPSPTSEPLASLTPQPTNIEAEIETPKPYAIPLETPAPSLKNESFVSLTPQPTNIEDKTTTPKPYATPLETPVPSLTSEPLVSLTPQPTSIEDETETPELQLKMVSILEILSVADELTLLPVGESINISEFPKTTYIQIGPRDFLECEILWEDVSIIDTTVPGRTALRGKLLPPQGYCFAEASEPYVEIPFLFFIPGGDPIEPACPLENTNDTVLIELHSNPGDFINYDNKIPFETSHGDIFYCKVEWDSYEAIHSEGPFSVHGHYLLPEGIYLKEGISPYYTQHFFVMKSDNIYLDFMKLQNGSIICTWLKEVEDSNDMTTYYAIKDNGWQIDETEQYGFAFSNGFIIHTTALSPDTDYYFKLKYQGQFTKTLHINICQDEIKTDFVEGDRDGGDNSKQKIPTLTQSRSNSSSSRSKQKNNSPSSEKTVISSQQPQKPTVTEEQPELPNSYGANCQMDETNETNSLPLTLPENNINEGFNIEEHVSATQTIITGERLEQITEVQGGSPAFEKGGVVLELPEDFTEKNNISNTDKISIDIDKKSNEIDVVVEINDKQVTDIKGSKIRIPENNAQLKKGEKEIPPISKHDSITIFPIDETGTYNTRESSSSEHNLPPKTLWLGVGISALCLFTLVIRKVHQYKK